MTYSRPSIKQINDRITVDIEQYSDGNPSLRGSLEYSLANALTGTSHALHGHIDWVSKQLFDSSCDDDVLLRRAAEYNIYRIEGYRAQGTVRMNGNNGAVLRAGAVLENDIGLRYITLSDAVIAASEAIIAVRALEIGALGNRETGDLKLINSANGINPVATVISITGGADIESINRVRERLAERKQRPPMGGNPDDYVTWAKEAHPDVTRAWCYPNENGVGTVVVRFVTDNLPAPIPTQTHIDAVTDYTNRVRPAGMAGFEVGMLIAKPLDIVFTLLSPNTAAVQAAVRAELDDMIKREALPGGIIRVSWLHEAISTAQGEDDHAITIAADVTSNPNQLIVLGTLTFPA